MKVYTSRKHAKRKRRFIHIQKGETKKAVYTHIKHQNRKRQFIHVENTQNEKGGLYTYKIPKEIRDSTRVNTNNGIRDSTRRKLPNRQTRTSIEGNGEGGLYTYKKTRNEKAGLYT